MSSVGNCDLPEGWYVELTGHEFDIKIWKHFLSSDFDPAVIMVDRDGRSIPCLWSPSLQSALSAREALAIAEPLINNLNGAVLLFGAEDPLASGNVLRVDERGVHLSIIVTAAQLRLRGSMVVVTVAHLDADGNPLPPPPPEPSEPQRWAKAAENNEAIARMLDHLGKSNAWLEVYQTIEAAEDVIGTGERGLISFLGALGPAVKNLKRVANSPRHSNKKKHTAGPRPINIKEARGVLKLMARNVLEDAA